MKATLSSRSIVPIDTDRQPRETEQPRKAEQKAVRAEPVGFELFCARFVGVLILLGLFAFICGAVIR